MKKLYNLFVFIILAQVGVAQTGTDAIRFSQTMNFGTARSTAMGGAFGALGGDLSASNGNPAGIGVFRKSEISITPSLSFQTTKSDGRKANDNSFQMGNIGGVFSFYNPNFDWRGHNVSFSYTNLNNFNRETNQFVRNSPTSFAWAIANEANFYLPLGYDPTSIEEAASQANIIIKDEESGYYYPSIDRANQAKKITEDGHQGEYAFSYGTNYKDKLYLGATFGIQSIYYKNKSVYVEHALNDANPYDLDSYDMISYEKITGTGFNFKFGVIYRPIPQLRIGAAIHTPTYYSMTTSYDFDMSSQYNTPDDNGNTNYLSDQFVYKKDYDLKTPWRAIISVASVLGQKTILSFDYEYVNYSSARFSSSSDDYMYDEEGYDEFDAENDAIKTMLRQTHNFRVGAEHRLNSMLSLRAGYSFYASPYEYAKEQNKIQTVSCGFGLNFGQFYCDASYLHKFYKDTTRFYDYYNPDDPGYEVSANPVNNKYSNNEARITLGVKF